MAKRLPDPHQFQGKAHVENPLQNAQLIDDNTQLINSVRVMVEPLSDTTYADTVEAVFSGSVGKHLRHILDHYQQFFKGLDGGLIDYDTRERERVTETCVANGVSRIEQLCSQLTNLDQTALTNPTTLSAPLRVCYASAPSMEVGLLTDSTPSRELAFLHSHTVHHIAMMTIILQHLGVSSDPRLALAPSTARYEDQLV